MYICSICNKGFESEQSIVKHSLQCWRLHNPNYKVQSAPCKCNTKRQINNDILNFFTSFKKD